MAHFVDTSALFALLDADDLHHRSAAQVFPSLLADGLLTHNYVIVEALALLQRRRGETAALRLIDDVAPALEAIWIDEETHRAGESVFRSAPGRVSFVDRVSFEVMRKRGLATAFAFDSQFRAAGFELVP
ncbi:MAG: type II toxin-antitoxin system VapC family toxin [Gaiellaceae bacterium]